MVTRLNRPEPANVTAYKQMYLYIKPHERDFPETRQRFQCMHHDVEDQLSSTFAIYIQLSLFAGTTSSCWEYQTPDREILKAWVTNDVAYVFTADPSTTCLVFHPIAAHARWWCMTLILILIAVSVVLGHVHVGPGNICARESTYLHWHVLTRVCTGWRSCRQ